MYGKREAQLSRGVKHPSGVLIHRPCPLATAARRSGKPADPLALNFPNAFDGLKGIQFVAKVIESSRANGAWVICAEDHQRA
ncbi:MAG TPA: hypothetical protein PKH81_00815 [Treponemataceae bacterium]|nr:hypothetical protein [Treponemataceae bacterium]